MRPELGWVTGAHARGIRCDRGPVGILRLTLRVRLLSVSSAAAGARIVTAYSNVEPVCESNQKERHENRSVA